jgi:hypothetical protein
MPTAAGQGVTSTRPSLNPPDWRRLREQTPLYRTLGLSDALIRTRLAV